MSPRLPWPTLRRVLGRLGSRQRARRATAIDLPDTEDAVIQIWAARTSGLRGALAMHCWLVLKPPGAVAYERWDVVGRRARTGRIGMQRNARSPREGWAGRPARLVVSVRGSEAAAALPAVEAAIAAYPYRRHYCSWPGPNCNSFVAHLARTVPPLRAALPPLAIGKDFLPTRRLVARAPSGTGWQFSLLGLAGVLVAGAEGVEINLFGLSFGWRRRPMRLVLPGLGLVALRPWRARLNEPFSPIL